MTIKIALMLILAAVGLETPMTIVDLQPFRQTSTIRNQSISLVNLNPGINRWFVLTSGGTSWHLENPRPHETKVLLDEKYPQGVEITEGKSKYSCDLTGELEKGRASRLIYYPLCGGRLYLRNPAKGQRTALEAGTEFLRTQVWGGENVIVLFHHLLSDRYQETGENSSGKGGDGSAAGGPLPALIDPAHAGHIAKPANLGIAVETADMSPGAWYPATGVPGVYVSVIQPNFVAKAILQSYKNLAHTLDDVEARSLCYLVAFDLDRFEVGYEVGTTHPRVNWATHMLPQMKDAKLAGPDGIDSIAPLVATGLIAPEYGRRTTATFTGGYKRDHSAFKYGELSLKNHGSHYGFIEDGVVFSKLQPGLATIYTLDDGSLGMKTWTETDNQMLPRIRHARQAGVPLAEFDDAAQTTIPGQYVVSWEKGNWAGSEAGKLRSIRGAAALQIAHGKRFLIYAVFSDATPSPMARVFQAYQVRYAALLDMNALEHTYCAVYRRNGSDMTVEHLMKGMSVLDKTATDKGNTVVPRFLGQPDNRDFFYVMQKEAKK